MISVVYFEEAIMLTSSNEAILFAIFCKYSSSPIAAITLIALGSATVTILSVIFLRDKMIA